MIFDAANGGSGVRARRNQARRNQVCRSQVRRGKVPRRMPATVHGVAHVMRPGRPRHRSAGPRGLGRALPADELIAAGFRELAPVVHEEAA
jgi:hypothetical protein